jgi:hypothetical protein
MDFIAELQLAQLNMLLSPLQTLLAFINNGPWFIGLRGFHIWSMIANILPVLVYYAWKFKWVGKIQLIQLLVLAIIPQYLGISSFLRYWLEVIL